MKIKIARLIAVFGIIGLVFSTCTKSPEGPNPAPSGIPAGSSTTTSQAERNTSKVLPALPRVKTEIYYDFEKREDSPQLTMSFELLDAPDDPGLQRIVYDNLYSSKTPELYMADIESELGAQYASVRGPEFEGSAALEWYFNEQVTQTMVKQYLVLKQSKDYYTGGAHGNQETNYCVIDTASSALLMLENIMTAEEKAGLSQKIEAVLRVNYQIPPNSTLSSGGFFEDTVKASENYFLTNEGVGFHWNPYDIGPYVMGAIEIVIPYKDLTTNLNL
ncbi:RsiV family protein [Breznakiellaceae bacterium SP9]